MALSKKAQWIVWDGRKNGIEAEIIIARCEEKGCSDSREDLMKAITARPYRAQPQRSRDLVATKVSPAEALLARVMEDKDLTDEDKQPIISRLKEKIAEATVRAKEEKINSLLAQAEAL